MKPFQLQFENVFVHHEVLQQHGNNMSPAFTILGYYCCTNEDTCTLSGQPIFAICTRTFIVI